MNNKVICVNDKFKPEGFSGSSWLKKGKVYTIVDSKFLLKQNMSIGYKLEEIEIFEDSKYKFFAANRFRPYIDEQDQEASTAVKELIEEAFSLQEVD
jgi:hypothetical protein